MGDLQGAARVNVARHGAADYESQLLSDAGGWLSSVGAVVGRGAGQRVTPAVARPARPT
jgi:probable phosphoglycerate mutase